MRRVPRLGIGPKKILAALCLLGLAVWAGGSALALGRPKPVGPEDARSLARLKGKLGGEIVFASRREGPWRLFRVLPHGEGLARLTSGRYNDQSPQFIRNGGRLVFQSDRSGRWQVWLARPDLAEPRLLSKPGRTEWLHGMSEDGSRLLVRLGEGMISGLGDYRLRFPGSDREVVVDFAPLSAKAGHMHAILAPNGRTLAGLWRPEGGGQAAGGVWLMDLAEDGKVANPRLVADDRCCVGWRADSAAFLSCKGGVPGGSEIWLIETSGRKRLIQTGQDWDYWPAFSPDGQWMVFAAAPHDQHDQERGDYDLFLVTLSGGEPVRLTFHGAPDVSPAWRAGVSALAPTGQERVYEAEAYLRPPARMRPHSKAEGGRALFAPAGAKAGAVFFGQYDHLPAGRWRASFRLALGPGGSGEAATLDVVARGGRQVLARRVLPVPGQDGGFQAIDLDFELKAPVQDLECRVYASGLASLWLDRVTIGERPPGLGEYLGGLLRDTFLGW